MIGDVIDVVVPIVAIMVGCCSNVISLEMMMKRDVGSGDLITFCQFVFVALEGLFYHVESTNNKNNNNNNNSNSYNNSNSNSYNNDKMKSEKERKNRIRVNSNVEKKSWFPLRIKSRNIPIHYYMVMVLIFFLVSVLNNKALGYKVSLPFHMIFRSGSLFANMFLGMIFFKKRYSWQQIASVFLLTFGVFMATAASASQLQKKEIVDETGPDMVMWFTGVAMLLAALLLSSILGLYQEWVYERFGKDNYRESMFYSHVLALPFFSLFYKDILIHANIYNESPLWTFPYFNISAPILWWSMAVNIITQYICIRGVFTLGGRTGSSLTSTLAISVRKFVSLVISVVYFGNPFSVLHWISTALVFAGTLLYTFAPRRPSPSKPGVVVVANKKKN